MITFASYFGMTFSRLETRLKLNNLNVPPLFLEKKKDVRVKDHGDSFSQLLKKKDLITIKIFLFLLMFITILQQI